MGDAILVTGATGTVGSEVLARLRAGDVVVRAGSRACEQPAPGVEWTALDFSKPQSFAPALDGVQQVFLLTPLEEGMSDAACALVERAVAEGVRHIVRLSAFGTGRDPVTKLGRVHAQVESCIRRSGVRWTFLRPNSFMQNYANHVGHEIRAHDRFQMPQGEGAVSVVDTRDIAAVAVQTLITPIAASRALELTGPEALSNERIARILSSVTGREIRYLDISQTRAREMMREAGMSSWLVEIIAELYALSRAGAAARVTSAVGDLLGRPPTAFLQFATDRRGDFC